MMGDPNFRRTVIFMLEHTVDGALGVVLNRPTAHDLPDSLENWKSRVSEPRCLFRGGPVQPDGVIALGRSYDHSPVTPVDLLDSSYEPAFLRLFHGYAGWGGGQLDAELAEHAWIVVAALPSDPFTTEPDTLWRAVFARQGGEIAWYANAPDDLAVN
jgi:putative transcriptional regulator